MLKWPSVLALVLATAALALVVGYIIGNSTADPPAPQLTAEDCERLGLIGRQACLESLVGR